MSEYRVRPFQILPPVVKNLLIINGIFFFATIVFERFGISLIDKLGLHYFPAQKFEVYQFITYMFMHGGPAHIFFNMFAVWMFGSAIENFWGPKRFITYYLITGIGASLLHYGIFYFEIKPVVTLLNDYIASPGHDSLNQLVATGLFNNTGGELQLLFNNFREQYNNLLTSDPDKALALSVEFTRNFKIELYNQPVVVGASGALFGILIAYGWMFPNSQLFLLFPPIPIKAKYLVIGYGVLELVSGVSNVSNDNVAHFAHIGGMLFGFIMLKYWGVRRLN